MSKELMAKITDIQSRYVDELMAKAHVVGVGIGMAKVDEEHTNEMALIVLVDKKLPMEELPPADRIPSEIEGVRVDVQETGVFGTF